MSGFPGAKNSLTRRHYEERGRGGEPRGVSLRDRSTAIRPDVKCPKCPPKADIYRQADAGTGEAGAQYSLPSVNGLNTSTSVVLVPKLRNKLRNKVRNFNV